MAITFRIAFSNPLDCFIEKILNDANSINEAECELVTDNRSILDMMCESITHISQVLAQTKDITYNVRSELTNLRPIPEATKKLSAEINEVKKEIVKLKKSFKKPKICPSCGNNVLTRFKICPYCGETLQLYPEKIIIKQSNETYKPIKNK
jgi:rubrerythrin